MQCPESDRARTGGKAWRWAHNVTSSEVIAFYTSSRFSLLYAGSLRRLNTCRTDPFAAFSIYLVADRLPRLALDGYDRGKHFNPFGSVLAWRAHAAHRVGSRDNTFLEDVSTPTSRSPSRSRPIASDAHACHRDQAEQGMVGRLAHPVGWHSQRCVNNASIFAVDIGLAALPPGSRPTGRWNLKSIWAEAGCTGG